MLTHPTFDQLNQLNLYGMAKAFGEIIASAEAATLTHAEWLALLLDREMTYRYDKNSPAVCAMPGSASRRPSRMSITDRRAASTAPCSRS